MDRTKRTSLEIWTIGAATLAALFFASGATANDDYNRDLGERINNHLDVAAAFAALAGDPYLAAVLDRRGDLIEYYVDGNRSHHRSRDPGFRRWRNRTNHPRHFDGCRHRRIGRYSKYRRYSRRHFDDDRQGIRRHKRHHRRRQAKHRRHHRH